MWLDIKKLVKIVEPLNLKDVDPVSGTITGVSIDSRTIKPGDLFIAIAGENHDGSEYIESALEKGASYAVTGERQKFQKKDSRVVIVKDSTEALRKIGIAARKQIKKSFIGITGSAGKTTTKEMTWALLDGSYYAGKTRGNLNNLYGLPLSLATIEGNEEVYVGEMGMSFPGELAELTSLMDPDIGVLLNVYPVHLVNFESIEGIARAKAELFENMRAGTRVVYNNDNKYTREIGENSEKESITYGVIRESDLMAENIRYQGFEGVRFTLSIKGDKSEIFIPRFGLGNVYNFLAAASVAWAMGVDANEFQRRMEKMAVTARRGNVYKLAQNVTLLDDSYNSNPVAMEMLLGFIDRYKNDGRKVVIAGDMLELGSEGPEAHEKIGKVIAKSDIDFLITVGELSKKMMESAVSEGMKKNSVVHFKDSKAVAEKVADLLEQNDLILVKASNGMNTDIVVDKIKKIFN